MSDPPDLSRTAEDHLKVIRQLMERATVYRVISAMPALLTGVLAMAVALVMSNREVVEGAAQTFITTWLIVYLVVDVFNGVMLFREARQRGAPFLSPQLFHAVLMMAPPMAILGIIGLVTGWVDGLVTETALLWAMGYGLGLVAMKSFAPRSILNLGWGFLLVSVPWYLLIKLGNSPGDDLAQAQLVMGATFGCLHVIYGVIMLALARQRRS